jgi:hypothetical protein
MSEGLSHKAEMGYYLDEAKFEKKVHLHEIFLFWFFALIKHTVYRPSNKAFQCFRFCSWIRQLILIF